MKFTKRVALATVFAIVLTSTLNIVGAQAAHDVSACSAGDIPAGYECTPLINKGTNAVIGELFHKRVGGISTFVTNMFVVPDVNHTGEKVCLDDDTNPFNSGTSCLGGSAGTKLTTNACPAAPGAGEEAAGLYEYFLEGAALTESTIVIGGVTYAKYTACTGTYQYLSFHFNTSTGGFSVESFFQQTKATPTLTTNASPTVVVGNTIHDVATVTGGNSPTGTIDFALYGPGDNTCQTNLVAGSNSFLNIPLVGGVATSPNYTATTVGTYRWIAHYSGDSDNNAVSGACNDANESVVVTKASPSISTVPSARTVVIGADIWDRATVTGGYNPTGTVTFKLFAPDVACPSGTPAGTWTVDLPANPPLTVNTQSTPFTTNMVGTWRWVATYSGDANNEPAVSGCAEEEVVATKATPTIRTVASPTTALGGTITDTATVSGGYSPTGTVTFRLYGPSDATCSGSAIFTSTVALASGQATSAAFTPTLAGTYNWVATYNGDESNFSVAGACGDPDESVVVTKDTPTLTTAPNAPTVVVGNPIYDVATISGGTNPTGTIDFALYGPGDVTCVTNLVAGTVSFLDVPLVGGVATSPSYTTTITGTYRWVAHYSGDANNEAVSGECGDTTEHVVSEKARPTLSTDASDDVTVGGLITDTATLTGGYSPTGTITFALYGPNDATCATNILAGNAAFVGIPLVNGSATSPGFPTTAVGTYRWIASYSGDGNNHAVSGACNDAGESVVANAATPTLVTTPNAPTVVIGSPITDTATISGGFNPTGTVSFALYGPGDTDCSTNLVAGNGAFLNIPLVGGVATSASYLTDTVGTYRWVATYSGDANNNPVTGVCGDTTEHVVASRATPSLATVASNDVVVGGVISDVATLTGGYTPTGAISFALYGPGDATCTTNLLAGNTAFLNIPLVGGQATSPGFTTTAVGTYRWVATYSGDLNNNAVTGACGDTAEHVVASRATPAITTDPSAGGRVGVSVFDTATVTGGFNPTGTVTFRLYGANDDDCSGPVIFTSTVPLVGDTATSLSTELLDDGVFQWIATYNGDANNNAVSGGCGDEPVRAAQVLGTITPRRPPLTQTGYDVRTLAMIGLMFMAIGMLLLAAMRRVQPMELVSQAAASPLMRMADRKSWTASRKQWRGPRDRAGP